MPLAPFTHRPITLDVADHATGLKQRATFFQMVYDASPTGSRVLFNTRPALFKNVAGGYGEAVDSPDFRPLPVPLKGDDTCAVRWNPAAPLDPAQSGDELYYRHGVAPLDWGTYTAQGQFTPLVGGLAAAPETLLIQCQYVEEVFQLLLAGFVRLNMMLGNQKGLYGPLPA